MTECTDGLTLKDGACILECLEGYVLAFDTCVKIEDPAQECANLGPEYQYKNETLTCERV